MRQMETQVFSTPARSTKRRLAGWTVAAASVLALLTGAGGGALAAFSRSARQNDAAGYLEAAVAAGRWVRGAAVKTASGITWPPDPAAPDKLDTSLYSGSSGVILFLLELHRATGDAKALDEARVGADHLITQAPLLSDQGLYTGAAGVGFTLVETFKATKDPKYKTAALAIVERVRQRALERGRGVEWSDSRDIIGGGAGIGLFLLYAAREIDAPGARELAARAGDRLVELAIAEHGGLKWASSATFPRLMPNFAHGTSGIAYFLASLSMETKRREYLDAALAGAKYLLAIADTEGNVCLIFHNEPDGKTLHYLSWCHGPAGTARFFYRLYQATGDKTWMHWMAKSARGVTASGIPEQRTPGFWNNVSQCCGSAGVAAFFLDLHEITREPSYLAFSKRVTADLLSRATTDASGMRWIQAEHRVRPELLVAQTGYMQGAAGIATWLLRLSAFAQGRDLAIRFVDSPF